MTTESVIADSTRNFLITAKIEDVAGEDAEPDPMTDAWLVEQVRVTDGGSTQQTNEGTGTLDTEAPIPIRTPDTIGFRSWLKGGGAAATPPDFGKGLRAAAFSETISAAAVPAGAPEACQDGGSTTTAILGASASGTDQAYRGMPIVFSGAVTGTAIIIDYDGDTKTATLASTMDGAIDSSVNYQIPANVLYKPISKDIESLTLYEYDGRRLSKYTGLRFGSLSLNMPTNNAGYLEFGGTGLKAEEDNGAGIPANAVQANRPQPFNNGLLDLNRLPMYASNTTINLNLTLASPPNPRSEAGFLAPRVLSRSPRLTIDPLRAQLSAFDPSALTRSGERVPFAAMYGSGVGGRVAVSAPALQILPSQRGDNQGLRTSQIEAQCTGGDSCLFLCFF